MASQNGNYVKQSDKKKAASNPNVNGKQGEKSNLKAQIPPPGWNNGLYSAVKLNQYLDTLPREEMMKVLVFMNDGKESKLDYFLADTKTVC
jgi:hypothetical protein